jgi:hypothetical protein
MTSNESTENPNGYMLDTTEFNAVAKNYVDVSSYAGMRLFATHVQLDELNNTRSEEKRARLLAVFNQVAPQKLLTESGFWGVSNWGEFKWSAGDGISMKMLARLGELDGEERYPNQHRDILIAETAIKNGLTLISGDRNLRDVTVEFGGRVIEPPRRVAASQFPCENPRRY